MKIFRGEDREKIAKNLVEVFKYMNKKGYSFLIRGDKTFAGVIFDVEREFEQGVNKTKKVGMLMTVKGNVVKEPLEIWDEIKEEFVDETVKLGNGVFIITPCCSRRPDEAGDPNATIFWKSPDEIERIINDLKVLETIDQAYRKLQVQNKELMSENKFLRMENDALNEQKVYLERRIKEILSKYASLVDAVTKTEILIKKLQTQVTEYEHAITKLIMQAKERGMDMFLKDEEKINKLFGLTQNMIKNVMKVTGNGSNEAVKQIQEIKEETEKQLKELKSLIKEMREIKKKEVEKGVSAETRS